MSDHSRDFIGHWQILVSHCPMTDCYLQPCINMPFLLDTIYENNLLHKYDHLINLIILDIFFWLNKNSVVQLFSYFRTSMRPPY